LLLPFELSESAAEEAAVAVVGKHKEAMRVPERNLWPDYPCGNAYGVFLGIDDRRGDLFSDTHARCQRASRSSSSQISLRRMNQGFQGGSDRAHTGSPCQRNQA
jgi:hypothetical protein